MRISEHSILFEPVDLPMVHDQLYVGPDFRSHIVRARRVMLRTVTAGLHSAATSTVMASVVTRDDVADRQMLDEAWEMWFQSGMARKLAGAA